MKENEKFGNRLKEIREILNLSQEKFGKIIDENPIKICRIEQGKTKKIDTNIVIKLEKIYNINKEWLLYGEGEKAFNEDGATFNYIKKENKKQEEKELLDKLEKENIFDDNLINIAIEKAKNIDPKYKKLAYHKISSIIEEYKTK